MAAWPSPERAWLGNVYRKINRVTHTGFRRIHVAAERFRHHGAPGFAAGRRHADAAKERMQRKLHRELGIERLKRSGVGSVINGINQISP